ncbi:MAG: hypothetical protein AB1457_16315 [Chloroflexota bacterium]
MAIRLTPQNPNGAATGYYWKSRAVSDDGQKLIITEVLSYTALFWQSNDGGATWAQKTSYPAPTGYPYQAQIASSVNGQILLAVANSGKTSRSLDGGQTWSQCTVGGSLVSRAFSSCAISADGQKMLVCVQNGRAYRSIDYGASWTEVQPAGASNRYWNVAAMSGDGTIMILAIGDALAGRAYISRDGGGSWYLLDPSGYGDNLKWNAAALSSDGSRILLVAGTGNTACFISDNQGNNWRYAYPPSGSYDGISRAFYSAAVSGDGSKLLVGGMLSSSLMPFIYASENGGASWQDVTPVEALVAGKAFVTAHLTQGATAYGYIAQTSLGRFWAVSFVAGDAKVDPPPLEDRSEIKTEGAMVCQGQVVAQGLTSETRIAAVAFNGWVPEVAAINGTAEVQTNGPGYVERGEMKGLASILAGIMLFQAQVATPQLVSQSEADGRAFSGKWAVIPPMLSTSSMDFVVAPGWQEVRPAGSFPMVIFGYYPSADGQIVLANAASDRYYLFRSFDGGQTWSQIVAAEFDNQYGIGPCAISGDGRTMIVTGPSYSTPKLWISRDYGSTWNAVGIYQSWEGASIAINYDGTVILICGAYDASRKSKGYISRNRGLTWQRIYPMGHINTVNGTTELNECWKFAVSGNGLVILAASKELYEYQGGQYVKQPDQTWYRSIDGGYTWQRMPVLFDSQSPVTEMRLNIDGSVGEFAVNNRLVSEPSPYRWAKLYDMALNDWDSEEIAPPGWTPNMNRPWYLATELKPAGSNDEKFLAGELWAGRLWVSFNSGATWAERRPAGDRNIDWGKTWITGQGKMLADGFNPYVNPQRRILYISNDSGATWEAEITAQSGYFGWGAVAMSASGEVMAAGRNGGACYVSRDKGMTWERIAPSLGADRQWASIAICDDGRTIVAGSFLTFEGPRAFFTSDFGLHWTEIQLPEKGTDQFPNVAVSRDGSKIIVCYGSVYDAGRIRYSNDGGVTWGTLWPKGVDVEASWKWVAAYDTGVIWASTGETMYRSMDEGLTWEQKSVPGNQVTVAQCGDVSGQIVYVGTHQGRLWQSVDWGDTWVEVRPAGNVDGYWYAIACNAAAGRIIAGNDGGKVYRSMDSGVTWGVQAIKGILDSEWNGAAIDFSGEVMLACGDLCFLYDIVRPGGAVFEATVYPLESEDGIDISGFIKGYLILASVLAGDDQLDCSKAWIFEGGPGSIQRYRCYLTKEGMPHSEIKATGVNCYMNSQGRNYLAVTAPGVEGLAGLLEQYSGGKIMVVQEVENSDGAVLSRKVAEAEIGSIRADIGTARRSVTISGYSEAREIPDTVIARTSYEAVYESGVRQWRLVGAPIWLRPGNTVQKPGGDSLKAARVMIWLAPHVAQVEVTEDGGASV